MCLHACNIQQFTIHAVANVVIESQYECSKMVHKPGMQNVLHSAIHKVHI